MGQPQFASFPEEPGRVETHDHLRPKLPRDDWSSGPHGGISAKSRQMFMYDLLRAPANEEIACQQHQSHIIELTDHRYQKTGNKVDRREHIE
jgi:hypothetical protein